MLEVRVLTVSDYEAMVELEQGVEGFVPRAEISNDLSVDPQHIVKTGEILKAVVIRLDPEERRLSLSFKSADNKELDEKMKFVAEKQASVRAVGPSGQPSAKLGDLFKGKLDAMVGAQEEPQATKSEEE